MTDHTSHDDEDFWAADGIEDPTPTRATTSADETQVLPVSDLAPGVGMIRPDAVPGLPGAARAGGAPPGEEWQFADRVFAQGIDLAPVRTTGDVVVPPPPSKKPWYRRWSSWVIVVLVGIVLGLLLPLLGSADSEDGLPEPTETSVEATEEPEPSPEPSPEPTDGDGGGLLPDDWEWPWSDWEPPWADWQWPWNQEGWTWFWQEEGFTWPWQSGEEAPPVEDGDDDSPGDETTEEPTEDTGTQPSDDGATDE